MRVANIYFNQGLLKEAAVNYQKTLELKPGFKDAYRALGNVLMEQGKQSEAQQCYQLVS